MINNERVDYLPLELEIPEGQGLETIQTGNMPELTQKNFAKLCRKVTEIQMKRGKALDDIENKLEDIESRITEVEAELQELDVAMINDLDLQVFHRVKGDIEDIARILSTLRTEAVELEKIKP